MILEIIGLLILGGIARSLRDEAREKAKDAYAEFVSRRETLEVEMASAEAEMQTQVRAARREQFSEMVALHHNSVRIADQAYEALNLSRKTVRVLQSSYQKVEDKLRALGQEYRIARDAREWDATETIQQDQAEVKRLKDGMLEQIRAVLTAEDGFKGRVEAHNRRTHELKEAIRDLGPGGRVWYERLAARAAARRAN